MKQLILLLFAASLISCAYQGPKGEEVATVAVRSASTYNDVAVDYCVDPDCKQTKRIGLLAGGRFMLTFRDAEHIQSEYADRQVQVFTVPANEPSTIRFVTEKTVVKFGRTPKKERTYKDYYGLGITIVETRTSYVESENEVRCEAIVHLEPTAGLRVEITHDHDDEAETCDVISGLNELQSEIDLRAELDSPRERPTPFYELSVADQCANGQDIVRLSGFRKDAPMRTVQASRINSDESAVLDLTTYTKQGDPLFTGRGELSAETWGQTAQILADVNFFSIDGVPSNVNSSLDTWHVEVCINGRYHSVIRQPREDATLRPLLNFLAGTEY